MDGEVAHRVTVVVAPDRLDLAIDALWCTEPLAVSEEQAGPLVRLAAGYPNEQQALVAAEALLQWDPTVAAAAGDAWVGSWREGARPHRVGCFHVRLPEHTPATDMLDLEIEPGATFGYGHQSTLLALELLSELPAEGLVAADIGSGSGVLAVAAALRGATVHAVDIDHDAVRATADNATRNGVEVDARLGSVAALPHDSYDLALVNVTAGVHRELLPLLGDRLTATSHVILSGLLIGQADMVTPALAILDHRDRRHADGWEAVLLGP